MKKLIFIETSDLGTRYCADAAQLLGFEPIFVTRINSHQGDTKLQLLEQSLIEADTTDAEKIILAINEQLKSEEIAGIVTFLDSRLSVAIEVGAKIGVETLDHSLLLIKSKAEVQKLIPEYSPTSFLLDAKCENSWVNLNQFLDQHSNSKWILKPALTAGAFGMGYLNHESTPLLVDEIRKAIDSIQLPKHLSNPKWLIQQCVEGDLVSLEGFVINGVIHKLGITGRGKVHLTESRVIFPSKIPYHYHQEPRMLLALEALVSRSGFKNGYFHTEFLFNSKQQAVLIDANFGRIGGGSLLEQISLSYGISESHLAAHVIAVGLPKTAGSLENKLRPSVKSHHELNDTLGVLYGAATEGFLESVLGTDRLSSSLEGVRAARLLDDGQEIPAMGINNWGWVGTLSGRTKDVEKIAQNAVVHIRRENHIHEEPLCY